MRTRTLILVAVALFAALVGGVVYVALGSGEARRLGVIARTYTTGKYALEIGGTHAGYLKSVSCGGVGRDVARAPEGTTPDPKVLGPLEYAPCVVTSGMPGKELAGYLAAAVAGDNGPRDMAIVFYDYNYKEKQRLELKGALLAELTFPSFDALAKDAAWLQFRLNPEAVTYVKGSDAAGPVPGTSQKAWIQSNFRFQVGTTVLAATSKVSSWSAKFGADGKPQLAELTVTVGAGDPKFAELDAMLQGLIKGGAKKTSARVTMLTPPGTSQETLAVLDFMGVGLAATQLLDYTEGETTVARRDFTFFVEGASLKF
jgi:hypothetical protein